MKSNLFVFDTNTLISASLLPSSISRKALNRALQIGTIVCSEDTINELSSVLVRSKFDRYISLADRMEFFQHIETVATIKTTTSKFTDCRDEKDNIFLNLAYDSKADLIVSGDTDPANIEPFQRNTNNYYKRIFNLSIMKKLLFSLILFIAVVSVQAQNAAIEKVTTAYIGIKNALVASNAPLAKSRSKELRDALSAPVKGLTPAQQKLMTVYNDKLKFDSRHISETNVIDHQREHFASLSKNMYSLLSGLKLNNTTVYQQYCPMKKASWLSETAEVRNPYYGDEMLECGKVTATIKGK